MKEVADEARGKEDIYKQLVMRLSTSECWDYLLARILCPWCHKKISYTGILLLNQLISHPVYVLHSTLLSCDECYLEEVVTSF